MIRPMVRDSSQPSRTGRAGFTLIEVLIVLALTALILVMLGQGIRLGLRGTAAFDRGVQTQRDMVPVEQALRGMLERADPGVYPNPPLVAGTAHTFVFTTDLPDPATGATQRADVRLEAAGGQLLLWWTPHSHGLPFGPPPAPEREVLLDGVSRLDIAYAARTAPSAWLTAWTYKVLPGMVRLTIVGATGQEAWPPVVVRLVREPAEE
jgi:prepilin-type N-terminal cleavage/methylation domain-containing protein